MESDREFAIAMAAQLTPEAVNELKEGIDLLLGRWSHLQKAIWNHSHGPQKAQQLPVDIFQWLTKPCEEYLGVLLDYFMITLRYEIRDGSVEEMAENLISMHKECLEGNFASIERLRQEVNQDIPPCIDVESDSKILNHAVV
ncbi:uncharacterized protein LOC143585833 [Bidens hawaiensis]|uniref:uncharacterized protein LOC143585833 n=1 Tax=Bidens hawaiensis TaxID=980011 RepID=UPI004049350C